MNNSRNLEMFILAYMYQSLMNGNTKDLNDYGLDSNDETLIKNYPVINFQSNYIKSTTRLIKKIELDGKVLKEILNQANYSIKENELIDKLVSAGANYCMLNHYFGISKRELTDYRKRLNVLTRGRKINNVTNVNDRLVIKSLRSYINKEILKNPNDSTFQCEGLLYTSTCTSVHISRVWELVTCAEKRGEFSWIK